jgi:hypothetical protein
LFAKRGFFEAGRPIFLILLRAKKRTAKPRVN